MRKLILMILLPWLAAAQARAELITQTLTVAERTTDWTETLHFNPIPEGVDSIHLSATAHLNQDVSAMPPDVTLTLGPSSIVSPYFDFQFPAVQRGLGDLSPVSFVATQTAEVPVSPGPFDFTTFARSFSSFTTPTGNGSGSVTTTASLDVSISYPSPVSIPEPSSLVMLGIGMMGCWARRRRMQVQQ